MPTATLRCALVNNLTWKILHKQDMKTPLKDFNSTASNLTTIPPLTADDWGMTPSINWGILDLAKRGLVSRVSMMANTRHLSIGLKHLVALKGIESGLHFNVTYGRPVGDPALERSLLYLDSQGRYRFLPQKQIFLRWTTGRISRTDLRRAFVTQLSLLQRKGINIKYLDSHHHFHLLPGVISCLSDLLHAAQITQVRVPYDPRLWKTKKAPINLLALLLKRELKKNGFQWVPCCYPQLKDYQEPHRLKKLIQGKSGYEVITHPSIDEDFSELEFPDVYTLHRYQEYQTITKLR